MVPKLNHTPPKFTTRHPAFTRTVTTIKFHCSIQDLASCTRRQKLPRAIMSGATQMGAQKRIPPFPIQQMTILGEFGTFLPSPCLPHTDGV